MPELPEVETVCRSLRPHLLGRRILRVEVRQPRLRVAVAPDLPTRLAGRTITAIRRRAKYIMIDLDGDAVWLFHLGMSGKLICTGKGTERKKHDHIVAALDGGGELRYHDPRRFGLSLAVSRAELKALPLLNRLGPDPMERRFNGAALYAATRVSARRIRDLLLDQQVVAGLGNIYANEILFRVGIRPTARARRLTRRQAAAIAAMTSKEISKSFAGLRPGRREMPGLSKNDQASRHRQPQRLLLPVVPTVSRAPRRSDGQG